MKNKAFRILKNRSIIVLILLFLTSSIVFGQKIGSIDLSGKNFNNKECIEWPNDIKIEPCNVVYPNSTYYNNYINQNEFKIYPDYHMADGHVKAGAYFKYNGADCNAEIVKISVYLPMNGNDWGYREHNEYNVRDPDWSGWWSEPFQYGYFCYTVKAKYNGVWYEYSWQVNPGGGIGIVYNVIKYLFTNGKTILEFLK